MEVEDAFVFGDGATYTGQYRKRENGTIVRHGKGCQVEKTGAKYDGEWSNNRYSGKGELNTPDGSLYKGDFLDNQFDGVGTYTWPSGASFTGKWEKNRPIDDGRYRDAAGIEWVGPFSNVGGIGLRPVLT
eukprot:m.65869 g.65869  ORF g.65869 m.65869 type:complete len:130 (-) comp23612_c0_seq1:35-424(-)